MASSILAKMAVVIEGQTASFNKAMQDSNNNLNKFSSNVSKIAGATLAAFGVKQVLSFGFEVSKLAGEAEGVENAFKRLEDSNKLLVRLKESTHDTVSELDLMKRSVQAQNFGISLGALPKLLEFATLRAQQTGQSVDYLVDSIVTGIGRKSHLILDNLGISAVALKEKMNGVSIATASVGEVAEAVGKIANENLKNMAGFSDNAKSKVEQLNASWVNYEVTIGKAANSTGVLGTALSDLIKLLDLLSGKDDTSNKIQLALGGLAAGIADNIEELVTRSSNSLKQLRESSGEPFKVNIDELITKFSLTGKQANELKNAIYGINSALTVLEQEQKKYDAFVKDNGYKDLNKAALDYIAILNKQIISETNLQQAQKQTKIDSGSFADTAYFDGIIKQSQEKIDAYLKIIELLKPTEQPKLAIIPDLEQQIKSLQEAQQTSFSTKEIKEYALEIDRLQKKLKDLTDITDNSGVLSGIQKQIKDLENLKIHTDNILDISGINDKIDLLKIKLKTISNLTDDFEIKPINGETFLQAFHLDDKSIDEQTKKIAENLKRIGLTIKQEYTSISGIVAQGIYNLSEAIGNALAVGNFSDFGKALLNAVATFMKQLGSLMISLGVAKVALQFSKNPYVLIVAGAALVAAGAAISSLEASRSAKFTGSFSGGGSGGGSSSGIGSLDGSGREIQVSGEFVIRGDDLVYIFNRQNQLNGRTRG